LRRSVISAYGDKRWVVDFEVGGPKAPYAAIVEAEQGILAQVLAEMNLHSFFNDPGVQGPRGRLSGDVSKPKSARTVTDEG
jgi:hypothetical protein